MGLAAMYLMSDELEDSLPIPKGDYDLPVVITDKMFAANGSLMYDDEGHSGLYGDVMLVNGQPWPSLKVAKRKYRFRILNASLSRGLRLQLSNSAPMTVIATDGGLMPQAAGDRPAAGRHGRALRGRHRLRAVHARHQDPAAQPRGAQLARLRPHRQGHAVRGHRRRVRRQGQRRRRCNGNLNPQNEIMLLDETKVPGIKTVKLELHRSNSTWKVNNSTWDDIVKSNYRTVVANPEPDEVQSGRSPTSRAAGSTRPTSTWSTSRSSRGTARRRSTYEQGPKDVAYVGENESVRFITKFAHQTGRYMIHCHNLPHEDHDMMTQFRVGADTADNDPMTRPADPISAPKASSLDVHDGATGNGSPRRPGHHHDAGRPTPPGGWASALLIDSGKSGP